MPELREDALLRMWQLEKKAASYKLNIAGILAESGNGTAEENREGHHPKTGRLNRNDT